MDIPIREVESTISGKLKLTLVNGRYCLSTQHAVYSFDTQYVSYRIAFEQLHIGERSVRKALILGYGLGSISKLLNLKHHLYPAITAVELDPQVIGLAKQYGYLPESVKLTEADAYAFMLQCCEQYDLINADLYVDDTTPSQFEKTEFLYALKKCLTPGGLLLFSRFYNQEHHRRLTEAFLQGAFSTVFPQARTIHAQGNLMLVWENI